MKRPGCVALCRGVGTISPSAPHAAIGRQLLTDAAADPFAKQVGMAQVLGVLPDHVHQNLTHWHQSTRAELTKIRDTGKDRVDVGYRRYATRTKPRRQLPSQRPH